MAIRERSWIEGEQPSTSSSTAQDAVLNDHPLFLGNLALALSEPLRLAQSEQERGERYLSAFENGEGVTKLQVEAEKKKCQAAKSQLQGLITLAERAKVGELRLPSEAAVFCLQQKNCEESCVVFVLPGENISGFFREVRPSVVEGVKLLLYESNSEPARRLQGATVGQLVNATWDGAEYVLKQVLKDEISN